MILALLAGAILGLGYLIGRWRTRRLMDDEWMEPGRAQGDFIRMLEGGDGG